MQILETITEQIAGNRLPLVAVTVAAVPCADTPFIVTMHWHGFVKERHVEVDQAESVTLAPVPSTSLQLNERWRVFSMYLKAVGIQWSPIWDADCAG